MSRSDEVVFVSGDVSWAHVDILDQRDESVFVSLSCVEFFEEVGELSDLV